MEGHITIHRKITEWEWYKDSNTFRVFVHLLITANWKSGRFQGVEIERGQRATSYQTIAAETGLTVKNVRTAIDHLKKTGELAVKRHPKFSVFTVKNYNLYQSTGSQTASELAQERQSTGSQPATIEESNKEIREEINNIMSTTSRDRQSFAYPYGEIVDYLNSKAGTKYRSSSEDTRKHIRQRFRDGYTLDDFKAVIDKKCAEWKGTELEKYLRPSTLFGSKFEGYLNQNNAVNKGKVNQFCNFPQRDYDMDNLEKQLLGR